MPHKVGKKLQFKLQTTVHCAPHADNQFVNAGLWLCYVTFTAFAFFEIWFVMSFLYHWVQHWPTLAWKIQFCVLIIPPANTDCTCCLKLIIVIYEMLWHPKKRIIVKWWRNRMQEKQSAGMAWVLLLTSVFRELNDLGTITCKLQAGQGCGIFRCMLR